VRIHPGTGRHAGIPAPESPRSSHCPPAPGSLSSAFAGLFLFTTASARPTQLQPTLLFLHGNAGNISHRLDSIRQFHELGLAVFILDYRGYGESEGSPTETGTYDDATAAWHYLIAQRGIAPRDIVLLGRSLGANIAAELATRTRPGALIMESAFTSVPDMAATIYPWLPVRLLSRYRYDAYKQLAHISCPLLIVHSRDDEIIPFTHGQRLFECAREPKQFLELRGGHNDGFLVTGRDYLEGIGHFLSEHLDKVAR
jgi:fermentation-respiration switch protein FrsA (DUF1100 family)